MRERWIGWLAIAAAPITLAGLVVGISLVDFNADAYRDPAVVLALGESKAAVLRVSYLLTALGSYVMLVPLLFWLHRRVRGRGGAGRDAVTAAGFAYLLLGAAGACVLAAAVPELIRLYAEPGADKATLTTAWHVANRIGEDGLQGMVQNVAGAAWWLALGVVLKREHAILGWATLVLGAASAVNAAGSLFEADALQVPGLTLTVLGAPLWSIALGILVLREAPAREDLRTQVPAARAMA